MTSEVADFNLGHSPQCPLSPKAEIVHVGDMLLEISVVLSPDRQTIFNLLHRYFESSEVLSTIFSAKMQEKKMWKTTYIHF